MTLVPDDDTRPFARAYVTHHAGGQFLIPGANGPQSGQHRVIVSVVSRAVYNAEAEYSMDDVVTYEQRVTISGDTSLDLVLNDADRVAYDAVH